MQSATNELISNEFGASWLAAPQCPIQFETGRMSEKLCASGVPVTAHRNEAREAMAGWLSTKSFFDPE